MLFFCILPMSLVSTTMKKITSLFFVLLLTSCANYTKPPNTGFEIQGASFNRWFGGQPGASGIKIIVAYKALDSIKFKKLYFQKKSADVLYKNEKGKTYLLGYINTSKEQEDVVLDVDPKKELNNQLPIVNLPFKLKENEIALSYETSEGIRYYIIREVKETKADYYP